jgi:CRISPR/Cas system-associated endoribonuclease Cas2
MIERQDVVDDDLLKAPKILTKDFLEFYNVLLDISKISREIKIPGSGGGTQASPDSIKKQKEETAALTAQQKELVKVQSQIAALTAKDTEEYRKQSKELAGLKQQMKEKTALGDREATSLNKQNASLEELNVALNANRVAYAKLTTEEQRASKEGKALLTVIQQQDKDVKELNGSLGNFRDNVGDYEGGFTKAGKSLQTIAPGAHSAATGFLQMAKAAALFLATGIGLAIAAVGAALFALTSYFRGSEEGQNRLNKIVQVGKAIFEQFMNVVEDIGEAIYDAFTNPKQAAIDLLNFLEKQFVNRVVGILMLPIRLAGAMEQVFKGNFKAAGKIAVDAIGQVTLGIENATDKIAGFIEETGKLVDQGIANGQKLADLQAKIDRDERKLIEDRAKIGLQVAKLRAEALEKEGTERRAILLEAIALEEKLSSREVALAKTRLAFAELTVKAAGDDKEALLAVANARAAVSDAEATAFQNTLRFRKEIEAINDAEAKKAEERRKAQLKADEETFAEYLKTSKDAIQQNATAQQKALDEEVRGIQKAVLLGKLTREQGDKLILEVQKKQVDDRIQIEIDALEKLDKLYGLSAEERAEIDKKLYELRGKLLDAQVKQQEDADKSWNQRALDFLKTYKDAFFDFYDSIGQLAGAFTQRRLADLDQESEASDEKAERDLEREEKATEQKLNNSALTDEQRTQIEEASAERKATIEKEAERRQEAIDAKRRQAVRKQAIFEKIISASKAAINLAGAIIAMLEVGPVGFALSALAAATGAVQLGVIAATPIPAAEKGIKNHKGGPIIAGEKGSELVEMPGNKYALTDSTAGLYDFPAGTNIYPADSDRTLRAIAMNSLSSRSERKPIPSYDYARLEKGLSRINKTIMGKPSVIVEGQITGSIQNHTRIKYLNAFRNKAA